MWQLWQNDISSAVLVELIMLAGTVKSTIMVTREVACIPIYFYTGIAKFTNILLLYIGMYLNITGVHFC